MKNYRMLRFPDFKSKALTLSYDDGTVHDKKLMEILDANGIKCTFNINSGFFAKKTRETHFTIEEAVELYKNTPHEIAIHGVNHYPLANIPEEMAVSEIIEDRKNLEKIFGRIIKGMAYANGSYDDNVVDILKRCGIKYARTTVSTNGFSIPNDWLRLSATCHHSHPELMKLADEFLKCSESKSCWAHNPKLFYLWGHSYEFNNNNNWNVIEEFAKKVGNREDVWYATNSEVYDYVLAYDRLEFSADGTIITNPTDKDVFLDWFGKNVKVSAGKTVTV